MRQILACSLTISSATEIDILNFRSVRARIPKMQSALVQKGVLMITKKSISNNKYLNNAKKCEIPLKTDDTEELIFVGKTSEAVSITFLIVPAVDEFLIYL